jgi:hypothetical protein
MGEYGMTEKQPHPQRCVIVKSCRECPWVQASTMPGIIDNPDGTPKELIWCLGEDNSKIELIESELDTIHPDCPLSVCCYASHSSQQEHPKSHSTYIRREVMAFATAMETTLRKHDNKGGWNECGLGYLLDGVEREYKEAREAWNDVEKQKDYYRVSEELVDVANFCMMFWERMEV